MLNVGLHFLATHRIGISRSVAAIFVPLLLFVESAQEGKMVSAVLFLSGLVLVGIATAGRLWCALYISGHKNRRLVMEGPYSLTRNPLYFFSLLGFAGVGFATETFSGGVAAALLFALVYPFVIRHEEHFLRSQFGQAFDEYCRSTPRFFPRLRAFREPESYVVEPGRFRRAIGDVLWFVWAVGLIELFESLREYGVLEPLIQLP